MKIVSNSNSRKAYMKPNLCVVCNMRSYILTGSDELQKTLNVEEDEWPDDPDTGLPANPW